MYIKDPSIRLNNFTLAEAKDCWFASCSRIEQVCKSKTAMPPNQQLKESPVRLAAKTRASGYAMYRLILEDTPDGDKTIVFMIEDVEARTFSRQEEPLQAQAGECQSSDRIDHIVAFDIVGHWAL